MPADLPKLESVSGLSEEECRAIEGRLFNIQPYSIHDGPGIRTTVFLNGCPLHCRWCQNPESLTVSTKLFFMAAAPGAVSMLASALYDVLDGIIVQGGHRPHALRRLRTLRGALPGRRPLA